MTNHNNSREDRVKTIEKLMDEHGTSIKRLIFTYVKHWETASDLTQDVFLTVFEKLDTFQGRSSLKTWVFSIAINKSKDYLKSWHFNHILLHKISNKDTNKTPEEEIMSQHDRKELYNNILTLPPKYRELIFLHYYNDMTVKEISEVTGLPAATIKTRLYRGKEKLKKKLNLKESGELYG
ncbi:MULTISPECIES: sigma-70 family RNA polymerase sigma factor [Bacillus]|uniref:RNA polymerase sigma-70 factor (ECF subfamily) n=1 Tax=Bacillus capparidis TaxID=1840411 RepID=A0ABS4CWB7_9BACI|nr:MULTISPECIES: sigma-70 family RNA polymerase sigma factor [Bacillus]MBP1081832.1 RNA polymerase sigma-70 factor (ECF subfamily) [Bacillus capparidis]MED1096481.1 sigma-70 family RNA polymerase sigma factor [Bacillus capparidis]